MEKTLLIAGKELPQGDDFAAGAMAHNRSVLITCSSGTPETSTTGANPVSWNRSSPISARSVIISCMNQTNSFDEAVLVFDEGMFASQFEEVSASDITRVLEELVAGYQYLSSEVIAKFKHNNIGREQVHVGKLAFVWISARSRSTVNVHLSPLVSAASAAFRAFAEATAASLCNVEEILPVLVNVDSDNDASRRDSTVMSWLCEYMDSLDQLKKRPSQKYFETWIKPGTKGTGGFGLFR